MLARDATLIAVVGIASIGLCILLFKEFRLVCFDPAFARGQGSPTTFLDLLLMGMVVAIVIIGLQAVGLILVIAILVIPPAAARFWTDSTARMIVISSIIGAGCAWFGAAFSALQPRLPSGAMIVLVMAIAFIASLVLGPRRGLLHRVLALRRQRAQIEREHALRAAWECLETSSEERCTLEAIAARRGWERSQAAAAIGRLVRGDFAQSRTTPAGVFVHLTPSGRRAAIDVVRRHRLWEHYLIRRADFDAGHVDRGADELEHLLPEEMLQLLEADLESKEKALPSSPHQIERPTDTGGSP
jgi:manganese/zinc/iron transport system permease protein